MISEEMQARPASDVIAIADQFPMERIIDRYARDYDVTRGTAERHARELRRFLVLCAMNPDRRYGMRGNVDDIWHTFLIYSRDYADFCEKVAGTFIHHVPEEDSDGGDDSRRLESRESYDRTLSDYQTTFGESPPEDIWPRLSLANKVTGSEACGTSCRGCGRGCSSCGHGCRGCTSCRSG